MKNRTKGKSTAWSFGGKNMLSNPLSLIGPAYTCSLTWGKTNWTPRTAWGREQGYKKKNLKGGHHSYGVSPLSHLRSVFFHVTCLINPAWVRFLLCRVFLIFIFNWLMIGLQYWFDFCPTSTWIDHRYTYVPSLLNLPCFNFLLWQDKDRGRGPCPT